VCGECRSRATLHKNLGLVYCRSGDVGNGIRELKTARELNPRDAEIETALAIVEKR
jgi:Flp pilus assembly protein TadD